MRQENWELIKTSTKVPKPDKHQFTDAKFSFPNYLFTPIPLIQFDETVSPTIQFIEWNTVNYNKINRNIIYKEIKYECINHFDDLELHSVIKKELMRFNLNELDLNRDRIIPNGSLKEEIALSESSAKPYQDNEMENEENIYMQRSQSKIKNEVIYENRNDCLSADSCRILLDRIDEDRRTTCMIKNIPNKYTVDTLIDFINRTHYGKYDFLYLRMDFKNKCNVGYAFLNFIDTESVKTFYLAITGRRWCTMGSSKVAELTYATIQGQERLLKKFRRSTVMNEPIPFRPKIFYIEGPFKGQEKPFYED